MQSCPKVRSADPWSPALMVEPSSHQLPRYHEWANNLAIPNWPTCRCFYIVLFVYVNWENKKLTFIFSPYPMYFLRRGCLLIVMTNSKDRHKKSSRSMNFARLWRTKELQPVHVMSDLWHKLQDGRTWCTYLVSSDVKVLQETNNWT